MSVTCRSVPGTDECMDNSHTRVSRNEATVFTDSLTTYVTAGEAVS